MTIETPHRIDRFTWENLPVEHYCLQQSAPVIRFMEDVVRPSIHALDGLISERSMQPDVAAVLQLPEFVALKQTTLQAFMLSLHSIWERQLRAYLVACVRSKHCGGDHEAVHNENWEKLQKRFQKLRGIGLQEFDSFNALDIGQLLANACRHGDGKAAKKLFSSWPDLWPTVQDQSCRKQGVPPFNQARLSLAVLEWVAQAVCWFWEDHEYIRCNSLASNDQFLLDQLERWRNDRKGRDLARPTIVHANLNY